MRKKHQLPKIEIKTFVELLMFIVCRFLCVVELINCGIDTKQVCYEPKQYKRFLHQYAKECGSRIVVLAFDLLFDQNTM